jgi:Ser/Thr protein kinase RdoA (MazF antagonist)
LKKNGSPGARTRNSRAPLGCQKLTSVSLGRYHMAVRQIPVTSQRPAALPLAEVPPVLLSHQLDAMLPERAAPIRQLAAQLARDLDDTGHLARERVVIHGDFTNDNVIARGMPPAASGVVDFR